MLQNLPESDLELTQKERCFLERIVRKYSRGVKGPLIRSLLIYSVLIVAGHLIERTMLPGWAAFGIVYVVALFLFSRYRRFGIFKSQLMRKLALREGAVMDIKQKALGS